jgi:hypothetical protein
MLGITNIGVGSSSRIASLRRGVVATEVYFPMQKLESLANALID